jgi:hypothetical protein
MTNTDETETVTPETPGLRCSDADRERISAVLHEAVGAGLLTMPEAEERLAQVYAARHRHELDALTADLPPDDDEPARTGWRAVVALAAAQLAADGRGLVGRDGAISGRRRLVLALVALAIVVGLVALALHGVVEGPEHHGLGPE